MQEHNSLIKDIFNLQSNNGMDFESLVLRVFKFQAVNCNVYKEFLDALSVEIESIKSIEQIPFLPIEFFKTKKIMSEGRSEDIIFTSSGTTGIETSKHCVVDLALYETSFSKCFERFYAGPDEYCILALLPSYLERKGSSLIYMAEKLIEQSKHPDSGFYLDDFKGLSERLKRLNKAGQKCLLLGVSFALLDLAEQHPQKLSHTIIMETGGMKGRRKEMLREELHAILQDAFGAENIHSEYGMTELLSQAYSKKDGLFYCPAWMRALIRDINDPKALLPTGKSGGINMIDLANLYSCSFIATKDLGVMYEDGGFEVLGRFDNSDLRGCNLMVF